MANNVIKALVIGCGRMGKIATRYLHEKGVIIVGAVDANSSLEGMDLGRAAGLDKDLGVQITSDLEGVLKTTDADIAVCALFSFMSANEIIFKTILEHGVNIITTCDEGHFSWNTAPKVTARLDKVAKEHGVTITGCGFQDVYWMNLVHVGAGGMRTLKSIDGTTIFNTEDYGPALAEAYKVGRTVKEFEEIMNSGSQMGDGFLMRATNDALCAKFGLTPVSYSVELLPCTKDHDIYSEVLGKTIPAGDVIGTKEIVTTMTLEGISVKTTDICYVYDEGEQDSSTWHLEGDPNVDIVLPGIDTPHLTMGTILNRIPDVINAPAGYVTNSSMDVAKFRIYNMALDVM